MFSSPIYHATLVNYRCTGGFTYFALHFIHATFCIEPRICYVAQIYGFYVEIDRLLNQMSDMNNVLRLHPSGAFATALSTQKNVIYRNLTLSSVEIVNDIRQVCLSKAKMTEKQRIDIVFNIRPKLVKMNRQLRKLTLAVKYTTFGDIWADIELLQREKIDKMTITRDCMKRWKQKAHIGF